MKEISFNYTIKNEILLNQIQLSLPEGSCLLINGIEDKAFTILGAILGKILPCMDLPDIDSLKLLYRDYNGALTFIKHNYPDEVSYIGCDPDRHLLFSEVWEELSAQLKLPLSKSAFQDILGQFSLPVSFLDRKIDSLSGGEKMKVALSLAFAFPHEVIILHGVVPWLDKEGRNDLLKAINQAKADKKIVVILEQEFHCLESVIDESYLLKDKHLSHTDRSQLFNHPFSQTMLDLVSRLNECVQQKKKEQMILEIDQFSFSYGSHRIYKNLSLKLFENTIYYLNGDNGTGKSTLANILFKMEKTEPRKIRLFDRFIEDYTRLEINRFIAYVGQFPENQMIWNTMGECRQLIQSHQLDFCKVLFDTFFTQSDAYPLVYLNFAELKFLLTIMLLTKETRLLILDEPTWSLDLPGIEKWLGIISTILENMNISLLIISHAHSIMPLINAVNLKIKDCRIISQ